MLTMSLIFKSLLSNPSYRVDFTVPPFNSPKFYTSSPPKFLQASSQITTSINRRYPDFSTLYSAHNNRWSIKVYGSDAAVVQENERYSGFDFDDLLSIVELGCLLSSVAVAVGCAVNWIFFRGQNVGAGLVTIGYRVLVLLLAGAVVVGTVIRRRQWKRACGISTRSGVQHGNVIERIEKLEESLKSVSTITRVLSRQLEKLGIRFRVTRKAMKEPISETAALAQKNSEVTRALAAQEVVLEKELAEVQNVLLAMQDHQQKQLELILAIAKTGKLYETKQEHVPGPSDTTDKWLRQVDGQQIQAAADRHTGSCDDGLGRMR